MAVAACAADALSRRLSLQSVFLTAGFIDLALFVLAASNVVQAAAQRRLTLSQKMRDTISRCRYYLWWREVSFL
jgi:hypothetical protein